MNIVALSVAAVMAIVPVGSLPVKARKTVVAKHLRMKGGYPLLPCPDMHDEPCVSEWKGSAGVKLSIDQTPTFNSTNCLKVEVPKGTESTLTSRCLPVGGDVEYDVKIRKVGTMDTDFGVVLQPKVGPRVWRRFAKVDWKPSFFPEWTIMHGIVHLPKEETPAEFVFRTNGSGTYWIVDAWARRRDR